MKKISLLTKTIFHIANIGLIILYLFPGSIIGWLLYNDFYKQPQLTTNFVVSSNHVYAFVILSLLGVISFSGEKQKILFVYLFIVSFFLELCHMLIPKRSFEYSDLFGNFFGVCIVFIMFNFYQYLKNNK
ncbi:hypothetical protein OAQ48_03415 [Candidatus Pelagibacter sp.]|jgi:hypothetical protein|nr:hypothetical protein [Candidatus Pelagibacter sp.]